MSTTCTMAGKDDVPEFGHVRSASTVNGHCHSAKLTNAREMPCTGMESMTHQDSADGGNFPMKDCLLVSGILHSSPGRARTDEMGGYQRGTSGATCNQLSPALPEELPSMVKSVEDTFLSEVMGQVPEMTLAALTIESSSH
ncbi:predicted protein [Histoplasma capsulatum H143]|uniref:Uncharacterized protein n=1 Tax=Ajellomyces capsulatus (strain H143) TaxID=544712 RepID=C6HKN4_AJECH|nr:predicted protein [Histoplasma capsulatum H143]